MGSRLGQHFLIRGSVLDKIASAACPDREPLIIEIGPGKGALTQHLLERAERVVAIEVDPYLVTYLKQKFRDAPNLTIVESDVLRADLGEWGPAVIAGNLPYYITSPIFEKVFLSPGWKRAVFLIQKEVAERVTASPGSRDYGYLTVQTQLFAEPRLLFTVPRAAFHPPPKVDSAVVALDPKSAPVDTREFLKFAAACFHMKRKTLRNNLRSAYDGALVDALPEAPLRAEQISLDQMLSIYNRLRQ